jgi:2,4-diketo-3-deoxy-L-fuconate hydrolase
MKLVRFGNPSEEKPGVLLDNGEIIDVYTFTDDFHSSFFEENGLENLEGWLEQNKDAMPRVGPSERLGAPIPPPGKILCIGLNYSDHAKESGAEVPKEPLIFSKAVTAYNGPYDNVEIPRDSTQTDWEVEIAFVIKKRAKYVPVEESRSYIAGYTILNDVSEREFQKDHCGQWVKGKSHDTFAPIGPYLVTPDEIDDVQNLDMKLSVNDEIMQQGNTKNMIFCIDFLTSYISRFMTLMPGDIISTGTPPGVGMGRNPQVFLKPGDIIELSIDKLGTQKQNVVSCC